MQKVTYKLVMLRKPCYEFIKIKIAKNYNGLPSKFIKEYRDKVKYLDSMHPILLRNEFMTRDELILFAVWGVKQVPHCLTDDRIVKALDVAEAYVNRKSTKDKLLEAYIDARYACLYNITSPHFFYKAVKSAIDYSSNVAGYTSYNDYNSFEEAYIANRNKQIDKLLDFFLAKEDGIEYDWS